MNETTVIDLLKKRRGERTNSELAREVGISPQYLHDVLNGNRRPSEKILSFLGLRRDIVKASK